MKRYFKDKSDGRLAKTRKEQFGYIIKSNAPELFFSNFLTFLFLIPLILTFIFTVIAYHRSLHLDSATEWTYFSIFLYSGLAAFISIIIFSFGLSGQYQIIKELVFYSTTKIGHFFTGIKNNFKSFFFVNLIFGVLTGLLVINVGAYISFYSSRVWQGVVLGINIFLLLTILIGKPFINFEATVFKNNTLIYLRNGVYLFYKCMPYSLISLLLVIVMPLLVGFLPIKLVFIPLALLATGYIGFSSLGIFLITLTHFEKIFTYEQIPEIYHKGLEDINL